MEDSLLDFIPGHAATQLRAVTVEAYNAEIQDSQGFLGDRVSKQAFLAIIDRWRERMRSFGEDPLGSRSASDLKKQSLDKLLLGGSAPAAVLMHTAIEEFAQELAAVIARFLELERWRGAQLIMVGGGLRANRVGEIAIGRAAVLLNMNGQALALRPIHHDPDKAGLIGGVHLVPSAMLREHDGILAVDIGGSKVRAGVVAFNLNKASDLSAARVVKHELWRHRDDKPTRDQVVERLSEMLGALLRHSDEAGFVVAPLIAIGCPGLIRHDGSIERGGQALPGDWESDGFNLPERLREFVRTIRDQPTTVVMHNDAVVQGLSEIPFVGNVRRWGVLTIGTGLGNACFSARVS